MIHARQIARRATGWKREPYTGDNPHDEHVHWNTDPAHENSSQLWVITQEGSTMPLTPDDADALKWRIEALTSGKVDVVAGPTKGEDVVLIRDLLAVKGGVAELVARPPVSVDAAAVAEALVPVLGPVVEAAVIKVLAKLDKAITEALAEEGTGRA